MIRIDRFRFRRQISFQDNGRKASIFSSSATATFVTSRFVFSQLNSKRHFRISDQNFRISRKSERIQFVSSLRRTTGCLNARLAFCWSLILVLGWRTKRKESRRANIILVWARAKYTINADVYAVVDDVLVSVSARAERQRGV